jgi:hypothetical protein
MKRSLFAGLMAGVLSLAAAGTLGAQYTFFNPKGAYAVEVSLENPSGNRLRLPIYRNSITSLAVVGDFAIGGTTANPGLSPFLFAVSLSRKALESALDLSSVIPGQRAIQSGFGRGAGGVLYAGTIADAEGEGGHLIKVQFKNNKFEVQDLGIPVSGEGVFSLAADSQRGMLYGISYPGGKFFAFNLRTGQAAVYTETALTEQQRGYYHDYSVGPEDILSRALAVDRKGRVYGSRPVNGLFRFDPAVGKLETLTDELPEVWGRRSLGRADAWAVAADGTLYGGNAGDGQVFKVDPLSGKVVNLGKPIMMPRIKGLTFAVDGKLYGVAGSLPGYAHLFTYNPRSGSYKDLGNPDFPLVAPEIAGELVWRGFQFATIAASEDGRWIVMGEEESLSQLMVFPVQ